MTRLLSLTVIASLMAANASGQRVSGPIERSASVARSQAVAHQRDPRPRRMPRAILWTGAGLLGYGGFLFALGSAYGPDHMDCPGGDCRVCTPACPKTQEGLNSGAAVLVGSGVAVLVVGAVLAARRSPNLPLISLRRRGLTIQQRVPLFH